MTRPPFWRRRFFVHRIQKTYALWIGFLLFVYSVLLFGLAYMAPYIRPALKLISPAPLEERAAAATQFLVLGQTLWPAILALIVVAGLFSVIITHRVAGPLYRLEQSAREVAQGNLSLRLRFRKNDQIHELSEVINEALANLDHTLVEVRHREANLRTAVRWIVDELKPDPSVKPEVMKQLELALEEGARIEDVLRRYRLSKV
ncbi:MAG: HAMP domain-containing protein [Nitrospirales bacterium]